MRIVRIVAIAVGVVIALVVVAMIAVLLFVDPNRYRGDIQRIAHEHTARELTIRGKLQLTVFPWLGVSLHDAELSNRPGFGSEPFLTVQTASIKVKVLPLLAKRLEVNRITLDGLKVNLVSRGQENNWQDLSESSESKTPKSKEPESKGSPSAPAPGPTGADAPSQGSLSIEGVDLSKSSLMYRDEVKNSTREISDLELHTGRLHVGPDQTTVGKVELQGTYLVRNGAETRSGEARGADASTSADPKPLAFSLRSAGLSFDQASQTLAPAEVEVQVGDSSLVVSMSGEQQLSAERLITGTVTVPATSPRKLLQSLGIEPPVTRDSQVLSTFALQTNFRLTRQQLAFSALQLNLDDTRIQGVAAIDDLNAGALSFDLSVNTLNVDRYRAPVDKTPKSAATPPKAPPTPLPLEAMRKLNAHGTLRVGSVTVSNVQLTDAVIPLAAKDGHIRLGPTQARLYGGVCNGDIVLDTRPRDAELSLNQHLRGTDVGALMKAAFDSSRISGRADANVTATGVGYTDDELIHSLSGKIDANVKQGAINGIDVAYELQRVNALVKRQVPPQRTGPTRTVFNTLQINGTLDKGVLRIDPLRIETDFLKVHGGGTLDTSTEAINYQLLALASGLDAVKSVEVPLSITGTLSSPAVRPDIEALVKGKLGQEVQQKAGELVKKKLGDKLKDLLGR